MRDAIFPLTNVILCLTLAGSHVACRCDAPQQVVSAEPEPEATTPEKPDVVFPDNLRAADDSVNEFLADAMEVCTSGIYDDFRLLWSTREDPISRNEFEQGWRAVREIRIGALERISLDGSSAASRELESAYAVFADVRFDPSRSAGKQEPRREIALMIVREHDAWRLSKAPKAVRDWIKDVVADRIAVPDNQQPSASTSVEPS